MAPKNTKPMAEEHAEPQGMMETLGTQWTLFEAKTEALAAAAAKWSVANPTAAIGVVVLVIAGILGTLGAVSYNNKANVAIMTEYAAAIVDTKEPAERVAKLGALLDSGAGRWTEEIMYMMGETAIEAREYDKAREVFGRLREQYPNSEFVPRAAEGIAFLDENEGKHEEALKGYQEVKDKWPDTHVGLSQPLNIARVYEGMGNLPKAVETLKEQGTLFPGSKAADRADFELSRLKSDHPELFPEEAKADADAPANITVPVGAQIPVPAMNVQAPAPAAVPAPAPAPAPAAAPAEAPAPAEPPAAAPAEAPAEAPAPAPAQ